MAVIPKISNVGTRVDLDVRQGATLYPIKHLLTNPDGTVLDMTGATVRGQVRRLPKSAGAPIAVLDIAYVTGGYTFGLAESVTEALTCGQVSDAPESRYWYDIEMEDASGRVIELLYGMFSVKAEVTRV